MKLHVILLTGVGLFSFLSGTASAQYYPGAYRNQGVPFQRPPVSPYLNLFNGGTNPAINYYGIIRPQFEFRNSIQQLQQQAAMGEQATADLTSTLTPLTTGHPSMFMSHSKYFQTLGTGTGAALAGRRSQSQNPMLSQRARPGLSRGMGSTGMGSMGSMGSMRRGF